MERSSSKLADISTVIQFCFVHLYHDIQPHDACTMHFQRKYSIILSPTSLDLNTFFLPIIHLSPHSRFLQAGFQSSLLTGPLIPSLGINFTLKSLGMATNADLN